MTVKQIFRVISLAILIAIASPVGAAIIVPDSSQINATTESLRSQQLIQRLEEIKAMDKSALTRLEKKRLRNEVRDIKKEAKEIKGGVYLSVGAIIIIILLLILLL